MPTIIKPICPNCSKPTSCTFWDDGSVASTTCSCSYPHVRPVYYEQGRALLEPHWWALRVVRAADKLTDCIGEFSTNGTDGKCLCGACGEYVENLDGALAVWKQEAPVAVRGT
jgi:hypothetical protein